MNVFAKFDEIPSMILQDIKETKRYGHTVVRMDGWSDNVKTVYPPTKHSLPPPLPGIKNGEIFKLFKCDILLQKFHNDPKFSDI